MLANLLLTHAGRACPMCCSRRPLFSHAGYEPSGPFVSTLADDDKEMNFKEMIPITPLTFPGAPSLMLTHFVFHIVVTTP